MFKKIWNWLVVSSADPTKTALTAKGFLTGLIPLILVVSPLFGLNLDANSIGSTAEDIKSVIELAFGGVGALLTAVGLIRKIYISFVKR